MDPLERIAEQRIADAIENGAFDDLPGRGKPLELEDLSLVPEDLRASYCLLKNANVLPEEMILKKELLTLGDLIRACQDPAERSSLEQHRSLLWLRAEILAERSRRDRCDRPGL